ncbi:hypothetical protein O7608_09565 [Solwaraspora sp. WMMA2056]|uniref:hypothetical protein n=1 Tax=Solwaraspora sp. WMMA2056 TaxID=3015161 RepID=UPI00259B49FB|nr:hypothetical protein [Solwaraspora sp. WMMA2056]WJK42591.1 hypothetical protein O7608_09565 [Solwaraspora sp. WMMA2056]
MGSGRPPHWWRCRRRLGHAVTGVGGPGRRCRDDLFIWALDEQADEMVKLLYGRSRRR